MAWLVSAAREALAAVVSGHMPAGTYLLWRAAATLGNTVGGVFMVSLHNYGQVVGSGRDVQQSARSLDEIEDDLASRRDGGGWLRAPRWTRRARRPRS